MMEDDGSRSDALLETSSDGFKTVVHAMVIYKVKKQNNY